MRRLLFGLVLFLLTTVVSGVAVPQPDLPETRYNEVDRPVNQATQSLLGIRFTRPPRMAVVSPDRVQDKSIVADVRSTRTEIQSLPLPVDSHALQQLLCTLLL